MCVFEVVVCGLDVLVSLEIAGLIKGVMFINE